MTGAGAHSRTDAPRRRLRMGLFPSFFYAKSASGTLKGFGVDLAQAMAGHIGAEAEIREYASPPAVVAALEMDDCDVALLGIDPKRALNVDYTPAFLSADFTFLLPAMENADRIADLDRRGLRVAIARHHTMDAVLGEQLKNIERVYAATPDASFDLLRGGRADVLAGIRPGLTRYAQLLPGSRILADRYGENVFALAVGKARKEGLEQARQFVFGLRISGALQDLIARAGLSGVVPIPL